MILRENYFSATRINWNDKAQNIIELAKELNISLDSMVFIDDDPTNRALIKAILPEVETPDLPSDPSKYASFLNSLDYFNSSVTTDEDKMRGNLYVTERLRKEEEKTFNTKEEFLRNLSLELKVFKDEDSCVPRLSQMTEKTNQFNINKQPLTEEEILNFIESPNSHVYYAKLQDKFGDYGVIMLAIIDIEDDTWHIQSLLMSCRVFGREIEESFLSILQNDALKKNIKNIAIEFKETPKNTPAKEFINKHFINGLNEIPDKPYSPPWVTIIYENI